MGGERDWLFVLWMLGVAGGGAALLCELRRVRSLRRSSEPLHDAALLEEAAGLCALLRLRRRLRLRVTRDTCTPLAAGFLRPEVLLPGVLLRHCSPAQVRLVLAHELTHVKRGDLLWCWLPIAARTLCFFHPVVWLAEREWQQAQELACDEETLARTGASPTEYGRTLLQVAALCRRPGRARLAAAGAVAAPRALEQRLQAIHRLDSRARGRQGWRLRVALAALALVALGPWRLTASAEPAPAERLRADTRSQALLERAQAAAARAKSLEAQLEVSMDSAPRITGSLLLAKPNLARIKLDLLYELHRRLAYYSDGRTLYTVAEREEEYTREEPGPAGERIPALRYLGGPIPLVGAFFAPQSLKLAGTATFRGRKSVVGRIYDVVETVETGANGRRSVTELYFGPTALVERVDVRVSSWLPHRVSGSRRQAQKKWSLTASFRLKNLRLDVPAVPTRFACTPPAGYRQTAGLWPAAATRTPWGPLGVGREAPDFVLERPDGGTSGLAEARQGARAVLVAFWRADRRGFLQHLETLSSGLKGKGVAVLGVFQGDVRDWRARYADPPPEPRIVLSGPGRPEVLRDYGVYTLAEVSFLIGPDGKIAWQGQTWTREGARDRRRGPGDPASFRDALAGLGVL